MSDIVERLENERNQAWERIKELRAENEFLRAENERLRASLSEVHAAHHECIDMLGNANRELAKWRWMATEGEH